LAKNAAFAARYPRLRRFTGIVFGEADPPTAGCRRISYWLLNHFLKLLIDYRSVKTINGDACLAVVSTEAGEANSAFRP